MQNQEVQKTEAAANYILSFNQHVESLNHFYCLYCGFILESESKGKSEELQPDEKQKLLTAAANMRYNCKQVILRLSGINSTLKDVKDISDLEKIEGEIAKAIIPNRNLIETFVKGVNAFMLSEIMQNLINTSEDFVGRVFNEL